MRKTKVKSAAATSETDPSIPSSWREEGHIESAEKVPHTRKVHQKMKLISIALSLLSI